MALSRQLYRAHIERQVSPCIYAAATVFCHSAVASARKTRSSDREMSWYRKLKVF